MPSQEDGFVLLTLHQSRLSVPPSLDPSACCGEPGGGGVLDCALPGLCITAAATWHPDRAPSPGSARGMRLGEQPTSISLEDFCVQNRNDCSSRKETARAKKGYVLQPPPICSSRFRSALQAHSIFCLFFKNNFTP